MAPSAKGSRTLIDAGSAADLGDGVLDGGLGGGVVQRGAPSPVANTTWVSEPDWAGKRSSSRSMACFTSVSGMAKPVVLPNAPTPP